MQACLGTRLDVSTDGGNDTRMETCEKWLILADDLTGACETGAELARLGCPTVVLPGNTDFAPARDTQAVVVNTDSRHLAPGKAANLVKAWTTRLGQGRKLYKKTDSTLRGNIGAELEAMMLAGGIETLPFVPAFPAAGRTTRNGIQYVEGVDLARTAFAQDPLCPVPTGEIAKILRSHSRLEVTCLKPDQPLPERSTSRQKMVLVFDAESDQDLERIVGRLGRESLLTASAGAAGFLGAIMDQAEPREPAWTESHRGSLLVVNGSLHPSSLEQVRRGLNDGLAEVQADLTNQTVQALARFVQSGSDVILHVARRQEEGVCDLLADTVGHALEGLKTPPILVVFGGQTCQAVVDRLGAKYLVPCRRLQPGVIELVLRREQGDLTLVSKSGGFGREDLLPRLRETFKEKR